MKKTALLGLLITSVLCAELRFDVENEVYYSLPKSADIDQAEYNAIYLEVEKALRELKSSDIICASNEDIGKLYFFLKMTGRPTCLRLISDIQQARREYRAFVRQNL